MLKRRTMTTNCAAGLAVMLPAAACSSAPEDETAPSPAATQPLAAAPVTVEPTPTNEAASATTEADSEPVATTQSARTISPR